MVLVGGIAYVYWGILALVLKYDANCTCSVSPKILSISTSSMCATIWSGPTATHVSCYPDLLISVAVNANKSSIYSGLNWTHTLLIQNYATLIQCCFYLFSEFSVLKHDLLYMDHIPLTHLFFLEFFIL